MACITADGTFTASGQAMLGAVRDAASAEEVAAATGLPLYRVRSGLRELAAAGLVTPDNGRYQAAPRSVHLGPATAREGTAR